ncbi:hypothetical protein Gogos_022226, partial [Gossypium gossypioides]|nr:hypothetical protein [Gossypium gossypioides]
VSEADGGGRSVKEVVCSCSKAWRAAARRGLAGARVSAASLEGYVLELWDFTRISVTQNSLQDLKKIWGQWDDEIKQLFYYHYGDLPYLLDIKVDEHLFRALAQYWNTTYSCFTFGKVDLVPTMEEYITLLRCTRIQADKPYSRAANIPTFLKNLTSITRMSEQ